MASYRGYGKLLHNNQIVCDAVYELTFAPSPTGGIGELYGIAQLSELLWYPAEEYVLRLADGSELPCTLAATRLESLGGAQYRRAKHVTVLRDGQPTRIDYREIDHCCQRFRLVDGWLEAEHLQRRGQVGHAEARLIRSRDTIRVVLDQLRLDETVFLHPIGTDEECDEARASLRSCCHEQPRGERGSNSGAQRYE